MSVFDIYSKRNSQGSDTYLYDVLSDKLRIQIQYLIIDFIKDNNIAEHQADSFWTLLHKILTREHGEAELGQSGWTYFGGRNECSQVLNYLLHEKNIDKVLDIIELTYRGISKFEVFIEPAYNDFRHYSKEKAIDDLNTRFKENNVGFKFEDGIIIKIDNELIHNNVTKPTLVYLNNSKYKSINDDYIKAHEHFRHSNLEECINSCLKAFESTMKIICTIKGFDYKQNDTTSKLVQTLFDNSYIPTYLQTQVQSLRATLESGVSVIRNNTSAHGKGVAVIVVDTELASYAMNLTGTSIKFLLDLIDK